MTLVAGSWDGVYGYKVDYPHPALTPLFYFKSHSTIKTVAVSGSCAVAGGYDDPIKIYDLKSSTEIGSLPNLSSTTAFSSSSSLISGDAEGWLSIYDAESFVLLNSVKVHNNSINSLSVHPSGKLALSVGQDEFMGIVNLVQGKRRFYIRLFKEASIVQFDESGDKFFMTVDEVVGVHNSENAQFIFYLLHPKRVLCLALSKNGILFTGGEDKNLTAWDMDSGKVAYTIKDAHKEHIQGIVASDMDPYTVASASLDGVIRIWDMRITNRNKNLIPLTETNIQSKLTCLAGSSIPSCRRFKMWEDDGTLDSEAMGSLFDLP